MESRVDTRHVDVRYVADLARIELTADEAERFSGELDAVLDYVRQLQEVNVDGIEPTAHALPRVNVLRSDISSPGLDRTAVLANAPAVAADVFIQVPPVLEGEES